MGTRLWNDLQHDKAMLLSEYNYAAATSSFSSSLSSHTDICPEEEAERDIQHNPYHLTGK